VLLGNLSFRLFIDPLPVLGVGIIVLANYSPYCNIYLIRTALTPIPLSIFIFAHLHGNKHYRKINPKIRINDRMEGRTKAFEFKKNFGK